MEDRIRHSDIDAIDVVQEIGEDKIKKCIFGVEE